MPASDPSSFLPGDLVAYNVVGPCGSLRKQGQTGEVRSVAPHEMFSSNKCQCRYIVKVRWDHNAVTTTVHEANLRLLDSPADPTPAPEGDEMFTVTHASLKEGVVGQVISGRTMGILWQSAPQQDDPPDERGMVRNASAKAEDLANAKITEVEAGLFE